MNFFTLFIPLLITILGTLIPINALNEKSSLGRTFFTDEQRLKVRYFNTVLLATIISFGFIYFYLAIKVNERNEFRLETSEIAFSSIWGIILFLILILITSPIMNWINNFKIKYHFKYKVSLPEEDLQIYIIRMHDKDTCVCSKNPNIEYNNKGVYILIPMQNIMGKNLKQIRIKKPKRTFWSKFFNL
ncbi:hypothetical protein AM500_21480 [Bacillus sp. FJAT-18017]|uniref:hypothetical protein n=1 Tax=Bacillus sp. FJAT-18017 TaxID=1705566 RepID=UPI0006AF7795|nr:hypothetical protein [Bacillus sp. FJAT-18017]ALC92075.1 hypothetical protein AM500_21480 [Bacillus sp. FJAT-18017]